MVRLKTLDILNVTPKDNSGEYWISKFIQPVRDIYYPLQFDSEAKIVAGTTWAIDIRPPQGHVWLLDLVTVLSNEAAAKNATMRYAVILPGSAASISVFDVDGLSIPAGKEYPIFPVHHDATGVDHSHPVFYSALQLEYNRYLQVKAAGAWTNGKTATVRWLYRRVL